MKRIGILSIILNVLLFPTLNGMIAKLEEAKKLWRLDIIEKGLEFPQFKEFLDEEYKKCIQRIKVINLIESLHEIISTWNTNQSVSPDELEKFFKKGVDCCPNNCICMELEVKVNYKSEQWRAQMSLLGIV